MLPFLRKNRITVTHETENSLFFFAVEGKISAQFELTDTIREGAKEAIKDIQSLGIKVMMLTGDHAQSAKKVAKEVGITEIHSRLLPADKAKLIEDLQENGEVVVMAGDGVNDAIALSHSPTLPLPWDKVLMLPLT